ncbi:hypothetical protein P691DRAFT_800388 [Macrolepiota fuliginosa MF-IS2]|uniref:F-box domain-containing protein n=1 Tax=Macrolepiota fuliginosa MF-IS2 TaxID=1400762 RepID=A0A9P5XCW9_9AGAR|nr:hypothetical protein P691DRAFT_800388 [Macrolepiota fuliginosa MF-IS2]
MEMAQRETPRLREKRIAIQMANSSLVATTIKVTLLELPPEILTHIFLDLPFTSVVVCQGVNRYLQILISESAEVQYYIHLGISGLVDNPRCHFPVSERLGRLQLRERHWETMNFDFNKIVEVPFRFPYYRTELTARFFSGIAANGGLYYMQIPSAPDWEVKWRQVRSERMIISMGACVYEQDLHVYITAQPRIIYTNIAAHRTVYEVRAIIPFETPERFGEPYILMGYSENNLLMVLRDNTHTEKPDEGVYVYDWRTSELKLRLSAPFRSYNYPLVLTRETFILPNAKTGELEYWRFPQSPSEPMQHQPFFVLSLPQLASDGAFQYFSCRIEPNPGTQSYSALKPFCNDPDKAIVTFIFAVELAGSALPRVHFTLFVHRTFLVGCPNKFSAFMSSDGQPKPVPYDEWGPSACRWFNINDFQAEWLETTFGQRCIAPPPDTEAAPLTLFDFSPIGVAMALATENPPTEKTETYDLPCEPRFRAKFVIQSMDPLDDPYGCFENTVYSSLPYIVYTSQDKYSFNALLLDEESVLGIREDNEGQMKEIHVLHCG